MSVKIDKNKWRTLSNKIYAGKKQIKKIYSGDNLIYPADEIDSGLWYPDAYSPLPMERTLFTGTESLRIDMIGRYDWYEVFFELISSGPEPVYICYHRYRYADQIPFLRNIFLASKSEFTVRFKAIIGTGSNSRVSYGSPYTSLMKISKTGLIGYVSRTVYITDESTATFSSTLPITTQDFNLYYHIPYSSDENSEARSKFMGDIIASVLYGMK